MMKELFRTGLLLVCVAEAATNISGAPRIVQSRLVSFPRNGQVMVQAREEIGQNPRIILLAKKSGEILLTHTITAADDADILKPTADQGPAFNPFLRFQVLQPACFHSPLILAVAVSPGGSDHGFWVAVIGAVEGKLAVLTPSNVLLQVQGGLYPGYLNKQLGCGFATWKFVWDDGSHYDQHHYEVELYSWRGNRLLHQQSYESKRK